MNISKLCMRITIHIQDPTRTLICIGANGLSSSFCSTGIGGYFMLDTKNRICIEICNDHKGFLVSACEK
jgi:hypothetical protein